MTGASQESSLGLTRTRIVARDLFAAKQALIGTRLARASSLALLYKAPGGRMGGVALRACSRLPDVRWVTW